MKVLMFGWEFPPHITGGLGTACYGLTRAMAQEGVDIRFVVPKSFGGEDERYVKILSAGEVDTLYSETIEESLRDKFSFVEIDSNILPYTSEEEFNTIQREGDIEKVVSRTGEWYRRFSFSGKYGANLMEEVIRYSQIGAQIAKNNNDFDVIHAHDWLTYMAGIAAKEVSGKPLVIHVHATEYDRSGSGVNPNVYEIEKRGMLCADKVITVSDLTRKIVIEKYGINANKVFTVHNAVHFSTNELEQEQRAIKDKVVTFLGRVTFQKGPEYFIEAAAKVLKKVPNVRFVMAGNGDMLNNMVRRVAKLGISDRFHFTGFLKGTEVNKMFSLSDVYVMPSVSEPFGISPLEAMRSNVPVIISKQSGVAEILRYAIKVNYWDVDALADAIYGLVSYPALADMFISKGQQEVTSLKWTTAARKIVKIYNGAL